MSSVFEFFDHKKYLNSRGVKTKGSGENVGKNWIGIYECPYCMKPNYHFGMNIYSKHVSCWTCGSSKSLTSYVMKIDHCDYETAISTIIKYSDGNIKIIPRDLKRSNKIIMPTGVDKVFRKKFLDYIEERGFSDPKGIQEKYGLFCTETTSEIPSRLVFPFFLKEDIVTLTHRTLWKKGYTNWPIEKSVIDPKSCLYNSDNAKMNDSIMVVEGAFDVIKGGDCFVGTSGCKYSSEQVQMILSKRPKRVFVAYDPEEDAQRLAKQLCSTLSLFCDHVENIYLKENEDIGSMSESDIKHLRKELNL